MVSPSNNHGGRSQDHMDTGPLDKEEAVWSTSLPTALRSGPLLPTTASHPVTGQLRRHPTAQLSLDGSPTARTKVPVIIPATHRRPASSRASATRRRRSRPLVLFGSLLSSAIVLSIVLLIVAPLANGQHQGGIFSAIQNIISNGQLNPFQPSSHITNTVPVPLSTMSGVTAPVGEGYCGGTDLWGTCATALTASGVTATGQMISPIKGAVITQVFGNSEYQLVCGCWRPHTGIDLAAAYGTPITASDSGQVIWAGWDWTGLGWAVKINHGHYIATVYGHLARFIVSVGQNVMKGQVIAYEGSTGASTGPHVHFMVMVNNIWVNPTIYMQLP